MPKDAKEPLKLMPLEAMGALLARIAVKPKAEIAESKTPEPNLTQRERQPKAQ